MQSDLTIINAEIKKLNVTEGAEARRDAEVKKAIGKAEFDANEARANEKITAGTAPGGKPHGYQHQPALTRGEFLLKHAKQMLRVIDALREERKLPHTLAFEQPLRDFVEEQAKHVADRKASAVSEESEWKETWEVGRKES